jgi:hypothetical protein
MSKVGIKQLVLEYLNSKDEGSDRFRRLYRIASLQGVKKFNMDIVGQFRTQLLSINPNGTIPFPDDYLDYSMIGVINAAGEGVPLKHNEDLVTVKQAFLAEQNKIVGTPQIPGFIQLLNNPGFPLFWLNYSWNGNYVHLYGLAGGQPNVGEFTIDDDNHCILVGSGFPYSEVLVEYLSNGFDCDCNDYKIHTFATDAFLAWLRWKDAIDLNKKASDSHVRYLRNEFAREKMMAKMRLNPVRISEMQREFRHHIKLAARA